MTQEEIKIRVAAIEKEKRDLLRPLFRAVNKKYEHVTNSFQKLRLRSEELRPHNLEIENRYKKELEQLRMMCALHGHKGHVIHDNGLGYRWTYCSYCNDRFNIENLNKRDDNV